MSEQELINHGNKIIAIFDDYEFVNDSPEEYASGYFISTKDYDVDDDHQYNEMIFDVDEFQYHRDWNSLMPVVNKIRSLYNSTEIHTDDAFSIIDNIAEGCIEANIIQVFESVVEFIEWYNLNNKK